MSVYNVSGVVAYPATSIYGQSVVVASTGRLYAVYSYSIGGNSRVFCAYSDDNGETWTQEAVSTDAVRGQSSPAIAIDVNDDVHIVWTSYLTPFRLLYSKRSGGSWSAPSTVYAEADYQIGAAIGVTSTGVVHVVYRRSSGSYYLLNHITCTGGTWGSPTAIFDHTTPWGDGPWDPESCLTPVMAIDASDNVCIAFTRGSANNIAYIALGSAYVDVNDSNAPSIKIDADNRVNLSGFASQLITYTKLSGGWSETVNVADAGFSLSAAYPSMVVDENLHIGIVWTGGGNVYLTKYINGWGAIESENLTYMAYPSAVFMPKVNKIGVLFVYHDGANADTRVKFYVSGEFVPPLPHSFPWVGRFQLSHVTA
jgi:hypothetical protein